MLKPDINLLVLYLGPAVVQTIPETVQSGPVLSVRPQPIIRYWKENITQRIMKRTTTTAYIRGIENIFLDDPFKTIVII